MFELKHSEKLSKFIKNGLSAFMSFVLLLATTGCASVKAYLADRGHDTMDIITVTSGFGLGAKAKAGPLATGLCLIGDLAGLRGGELFTSAHAKAYSLWSPIPLSFIETGAVGGIERWNSTMPDTRHKDYEAGTRWPLLISDFFFAEGDACHHDNENAWLRPYPYQVEVGAGMGLSAQIGVNPAECLDLALGFIGIDLFGDDQCKLELEKGLTKRLRP